MDGRLPSRDQLELIRVGAPETLGEPLSRVATALVRRWCTSSRSKTLQALSIYRPRQALHTFREATSCQGSQLTTRFRRSSSIAPNRSLVRGSERKGKPGHPAGFPSGSFDDLDDLMGARLDQDRLIIDNGVPILGLAESCRHFSIGHRVR